MTTRSTLRAVGALCAAVLLTAGCASDRSDGADETTGTADAPVVAAETSAPAAEEAEQETPEPEAPEAEAEAPEGFHTAGWGPLTTGLTPEEVDGLGFGQTEIMAQGAGSLCSTSRVEADGDTVYVTYKSGVVYGVSNAWGAERSDAETADGLRVGDPESRIAELYPGAEQTGSQVGMISVITDPADPASALSVTAPGGTVEEIRGGDAEFAKHFEACIDFSGGAG